MSQYDELDRLIISAIASRSNPLYDRLVRRESARIASETGREDFRVTDGRLQALRKAGKIAYRTKAEADGRHGWYVL